MSYLYRSDAPETSKAAGDSIDATRLMWLVRGVIETFGDAGCISDQVRQALPDLSYSSVTARYVSLIDKGLIRVVGGDTRTGASGRQQRVMRASDPIADAPVVKVIPKSHKLIFNDAIAQAILAAESVDASWMTINAIRDLKKDI